MSCQELSHSVDTYGGANVDPAQLPQDAAEFQERLQLSLDVWLQRGVKGVWLKLPINLSELVPVAIKHGFTYHSASADTVVLCRWLPPSKSVLPAGPTAQVGVGAYILSSDNKILLVREACGPAAAAGIWKVPTGLLERGEDIATAITREVLEETGLRVSFVGVLGLLRRWQQRSLSALSFPSYFCCRGGIAVGGFDDMFITCACTLNASSLDACLELQAEELAGTGRCRSSFFPVSQPARPGDFLTQARSGCRWKSLKRPAHLGQ
jgi:hypothetical protein